MIKNKFFMKSRLFQAFRHRVYVPFANLVGHVFDWKNGVKTQLISELEEIGIDPSSGSRLETVSWHKLQSVIFFAKSKGFENFVDIGCGLGAVAIDIASMHKKCFVMGIDINKENIDKARQLKRNTSLKNIVFRCDDINNLLEIKADVVILSNILEHIEERREFLQNIIKKTSAKKYLIRGPLFERDWQIPLRKELGIDYFSDVDHKVEHKLEEFKSEIFISNLKITEILTMWGEIWAKCENEQ